MPSDMKMCPNCETEINGPYCVECGQRQIDLDRPFREIVGEGLSTFIAFDTRLVRTLKPLVRRPGFLTGEFLAGRRVRYVHPFKLYFAFSLVFFFTFGQSDYSMVHVDEPGIVSIQTDDGGSEPAAGTADGETTIPSAAAPLSPEMMVLDAFIARLLEVAEESPKEFDRLFIDRLSTVLIVLVPVVALLLQMLYWKSRFVTHLVFSLHVHSFAFLTLVTATFVDGLLAVIGFDGATVGYNTATLVIPIYIFLALRRFAGQGRLLTLVKVIALLFGYVIALSLTLLGTLIVTVEAM